MQAWITLPEHHDSSGPPQGASPQPAPFVPTTHTSGAEHSWVAPRWSPFAARKHLETLPEPSQVAAVESHDSTPWKPLHSSYDSQSAERAQAPFTAVGSLGTF